MKDSMMVVLVDGERHLVSRMAAPLVERLVAQRDAARRERDEGVRVRRLRYRVEGPIDEWS
jgi:hypothetical protein